MAGESLRREVLKSFKAVHRARTYIFEGDPHALDKARQEINENYKKNKNETDNEKVKELIKLAYDVAAELRTSVLKMSETKSGRLYVHLRPEMFQDESTTAKSVKHSVKCSSKREVT